MAGPLFAFAAENMLKQLAAGAGPGKDTVAADLANIQKRVDAIEKDTKKVLENQDRMKDQVCRPAIIGFRRCILTGCMFVYQDS